MDSPTRLPIYGPPDNTRPMKRHHTARYYVHRVKESLTTRVSKLVCSIFLTFLFIVGTISFILWLSLRPHRPHFFIHEFSVPGLGQENGYENAQITFNVTTRNANLNMGIYYDAMQVTVYYEDQSIGGATLLFPFYQQPKNTTVLFGTLSGPMLTLHRDRWMQIMADRSRGTVIFRLELTSVIRFKVSTWNSKHHRAHANCAIGVGPDGLLLPTYMDKRCPVYFT